MLSSRLTRHCLVALALVSLSLPASWAACNVAATGVEVPGGAVAATLKGAGDRIYDCSTGTPAPNSTAVGDITGDYTGSLKYNDVKKNQFEIDLKTPTGVRTVVLQPLDPATTRAVPGVLSDARWAVDTDTGSPPFAYLTRTGATGGAVPASCNGMKAVKVPFTAVYTFYNC